MVVCIVDFVDWLVMAIGEDGRFAFMRVHIVDTMLKRLLGEDGRVDDLRNVFGNRIEMFFLERTGASRTMSTTANRKGI